MVEIPYSAAAKNAMLDALAALALRLSAHTAYSDTGANEVAGGSPAYARKAIAWNAAAAGQATNSSSPSLDIPAGTTVRWLGLWNVAGSAFYGMVPNGGGTPVEFTADDGTDVLTAIGHTFADGDTVVVFADYGALPTGLVKGTVYYVRDAVASTSFKLAATAGGAAINLTTDGNGFAQKIVEEVYGAQGVLVATTVTLDLNAVAD